MLNPPALYPYQETGAGFLQEARVRCLADQMGLGKTRQAIVAADRLGAKSLLVVTVGIARDAWDRELRHCQGCDRSIQVVRSAADAKDLYGDILIVSYSLLSKILPALLKRCYDILILDEAQALKNVEAARTKAVYGRQGLITRARRVWLLTGTLMPNHPGEVWPHYYTLRLGDRPYPEFVERYCLTQETIYGRRIIGANPEHAEELAAILAPHILRRRVDDVLPDLPPLRLAHMRITPDEVPPAPDAPIEIDAILGKLERDEELDVTEQLALASLRRWTGIAKAPAIVELVLDELQDTDKLVIFAVHREVIAMLQDGLGTLAAAIHGSVPAATRQQLIDAFQASPAPRVLIIQIATGGTAITLTRASRVIFAETSWTPADLLQAAHRCRRIGQQRPVYASIVSLAGSIDGRVNAVLLRKATELAALDSLITKRQQDHSREDNP